MSWFSNLKIGKKLGLGFGIVILLVVGLGVFSLLQMSKLNANALDLGSNWLPSVREISQLRFDASTVRRWELNYLIVVDKEDVRKKIEANLANMAEDEKRYEPMISSDEERRLYQGFRSEWDKHLVVKNRMVDLVNQGKEKEAIIESASEGVASFTAADQFLGEGVKLNVKGGEDAVKSAGATYTSSRYWVIGLLTGVILIALLVAIGIARGLSAAAAGMLTMIQHVAANNLTIADMEIRSQDEIGQAGIALNKMKNNLQEVIQSIANNAVQVAGASEELSINQPADHRQLGGNLGPGQSGFQRHPASQPEPADRGHRRGRDGQHHQGNRQERHRGRQGRDRRRQSGGKHHRHRVQAGRFLHRNRPGDQSHHLHRAADQPAGSERHHRSRARRRSRQRLRCGRQRSQRTGQRNRQSHRRHQPQD